MKRIPILILVLLAFGSVGATAQWVQMGGGLHVKQIAVSGSNLFAAAQARSFAVTVR